MAISKNDIENVLDMLRPSLQMDGGDLELLDVSDDNVITVRFQGACRGCPHARVTFQQYIERNLKQQIPEIKEVILG